MARVLVISGHKPLRAVVTRILDTAGHAVHSAAALPAVMMPGSAAADLLIIEAPGLVAGAADAVQALRRQCRGLRVIVMSAGELGTDLAYAARIGAERILPIPFSMRRLTAAVEALLPAPDEEGAPAVSTLRRPPGGRAARQARDREREV